MDPSVPHPERFEVYTVLPGGKGFTIPNCKFVFKLDRYNGWKDEYGNYYNSNGDPDFEPEDGELTPSQGSVDEGPNYDDYDEYAPDDEEDYDNDDNDLSAHEIRKISTISKNMEILSQYPANKPLRVYFDNMPFKAWPKSVYEAYAAKISGILNIQFELDELRRRNGKGYFIMKNAELAQELIKLEGVKVLEREVGFKVEQFEQLCIEPLKQSELTLFCAQKKDNNIQQKKEEKKVYVHAHVQEKKEEVNQKQVETKKQPATIPKVEEAPEFERYKINFEIFVNKTKFLDWMDKNNAKAEVDFKNIGKKEKDGKIEFVYMDMKPALAKKCNGQDYFGSKVVIAPYPR